LKTELPLDWGLVAIRDVQIVADIFHVEDDLVLAAPWSHRRQRRRRCH
jgi:hypothetical protein